MHLNACILIFPHLHGTEDTAGRPWCLGEAASFAKELQFGSQTNYYINLYVENRLLGGGGKERQPSWSHSAL